MNHSRRFIIVAIFAFVAILLFADAARSSERVRIGIVTDGPWSENTTIADTFIREILALTEGNYIVDFPDELFIECDYSVEDIRGALNRLLNDSSCNLVIAMGVIASNEVIQMGALPKPVIAPFIIAPEFQATPISGAASGVENLSYLISPFNLQRDIKAFMQFVEFDKLVLLSAAPYVDAIPELSAKMAQATSLTGAEVIVIPVRDSAQDALDAIPEDADAVFMSGMVHLPRGGFETLVQGLIDKKLPSFSLLGRMDVERGILFGLAPGTTFPRFARRVALHVQQILMGVDAGTLPVAFTGGEQLTVNMATARKIGVFPNWEVLTEAELIGLEERRVDATWGMRSVMDEALRVNRDLNAAARAVDAGAQEITRARSGLLPQVSLDGTGLLIDEDRAEASIGSQPEKTLSGGLSASQVLWSERAWANLSIQNKVQDSREFDYNRTRLDVALEALTAFFNVLRTKTNEGIVRDNLKLTRSNLELARTRRAIGIGGPGEVYRWETAMARIRKEAIDINAVRNVAELQLNRVLHRPIEQSFATEEFGMDDPDVLRYQEGFLTYFDNPYSFRVMRNFLVKDGLAASPELSAIDAAIAAQERLLKSNTYAFYSPDLVLFGSVDHVFWKDGAGSDPAAGSMFPLKDDTDWAVGIELQFPLFESGAKVADRRQSSEELVQLKIEKQATAERIEQRIRTALHSMGAAYAGIDQTRDAADAAGRNLDVILDAYSQGTVSILDLLDAQNSAFESESLAADAIYVFFINLMEVERAIGKFYFFTSQEEIDAVGVRFDKYLAEHPITY